RRRPRTEAGAGSAADRRSLTTEERCLGRSRLPRRPLGSALVTPAWRASVIVWLTRTTGAVTPFLAVQARIQWRRRMVRTSASAGGRGDASARGPDGGGAVDGGARRSCRSA